VTKPAQSGEKSPVPVEAVEPPVGVVVPAVVPPVALVPVVPVLPPVAEVLAVVVVVVLPPAGALDAGVVVIAVLPPAAEVAGVVDPPVIGSLLVVGLLLPQPKDPSASDRSATVPMLLILPLVIEPSLV
jgi:hypothetical protein